MAWNISTAKRRALVALQLRDKNGRFIDMGKSVKWFSSPHKMEVSGKVEDGEGTSAIVRMETGPEKGKLVKVQASQIEVIESKASLDPKGTAPNPTTEKTSLEIPNPKNDPDYDATMEKYSLPEGTFKPIITKTPDGNAYISAEGDGDIYTPAKTLAVGDEVIAPHGADPAKPFSMGKAWAYKKAERVNTDGPQIGKVVSIKEHAYAVVQLTEGHEADSVKNPGEKTNTVTIGLSNKVIKATPELKAALKDVIGEPVYADPNAPEVVEAEAASREAEPTGEAPNSPVVSTDPNVAPESEVSKSLDLAAEALAMLRKKLEDDSTDKSTDEEPFEPVLPSQLKAQQRQQDLQEQVQPNLVEPDADSGESSSVVSDKWDADGSWLKAVEDRYKANPNKAKATVQESNNWPLVQKALEGDKNAVDSLLQAKYLDDAMAEDAKASIDAHDAAFVAANPAPSGAKPGAKPLKGYELKANKRGVFTPTEKLSPGAQMGLFNGNLYPTSLPFMLRDTDSGDTYYWDKTGTRRWGQYGAAGALTRRKNANGEFEYLLAQRGADMSSGANKWALPGGAHKYESDAKSNGLTAKTELKEELGLDSIGEPVANYKHEAAEDWAYDYAIFDAPEGQEPDWANVDSREIQDLKWLTADEIKQMRDNGELQADMASVVDDVLNASESVQKDEEPATTPETDSDAPEAPSQDDQATSGPDVEDTSAPTKEEVVSEEAEPAVNVDGPSVMMADGKPAYEGSRVAHAKFGAGTVLKVIAGKSARIKYDDGSVKIAQGHKIQSYDGAIIEDAPVDVSKMSPGEWGNNPANGKLFIVSADGKPLYQGDKVEAMHGGEKREGVVKGIYKTINSVAVVFDGEKKPATKKAAVVTSLENGPEAPASVSESKQDSGTSKYNEGGFTDAEQAEVDALEAELAKGWTADVSAKLDDLYEKGDARLSGKDVPEESVVSDDQPEPVDSVESTETDSSESNAPEEAPETPSTEDAEDPDAAFKDHVLKYTTFPEDISEEDKKLAIDTAVNTLKMAGWSPDSDQTGQPEALGEDEESTKQYDYETEVIKTMEQAVEGDTISSEKLGKTFTKTGTGYWWEDEDGKKLADDEVIAENLTDDWSFAPISYADAEKLKAEKSEESTESEEVQSTFEDFEPNPDGDSTIPDPDEVPAKFPKKASEASPGTTLAVSTAENNVFVKKDDGQWELEINGYQTGIMANDDQVDGVYFNGNEFFNIDNAKPVKVQAPEEEPTPQPFAADDFEENLADWEKELLGLNDEKKAVDYDSIPSVDEIDAPTYTELNKLFPGTQIVGDNDPSTVWVKDEGDYWLSDKGDKAKSQDLQFWVNKVKIIKDGPTPEPKTNNFDSFDGDILVAPSGSQLDDLKKNAKVVMDDWNNNHVWKKVVDGNTGLGDGKWANEEGDVLYSEELADGSDFKVIDKGADQADLTQEYESKKAEMVDKFLIPVSKLPIGTIVGDDEADHWVKVEADKWQNWYSQEPMYSFYSDAEIAELQELPKYSIDNAIVPKVESDDAPVASKKMSEYSVDEFNGLPTGTKVDTYAVDSDNKIGTYTKLATGEWSYTSTDGSYVDMVHPSDTWDDLVGDTQSDAEFKVVLPESATGAAPKAKKLNSYSDEEWAAVPVGTKIYLTKDGSPNGTYTKTDTGFEFQYPNNGEKVPLPSSVFDAYVGQYVYKDTDMEVILPGQESSSAKPAEPVTPTVESAIKKHMSSDPDAYDKLPVGTTIKPEKASSLFYPNDTYFVKQSDGSWKQYKKTPMKLTASKTYTSLNLAVKHHKVTVSVPKSNDHAVLGTGEIAYVGDTVVGKSEGYIGNSYTIQKINKGGLKVLDSNGNSVLIKPKDLGSDPDFGKKESAPAYTPDPVTQASQQSTQDAHAQIVAEQQMEAAKKKTETFAGASADEYDAAGVVMPSSENPPTKHGLKVMEFGEPDTSHPLYGTPKPQAPGNPANYPAFQQPELKELPKWDSTEWLKAVEARYEANPHKAKATVQQSNNWGLVQTAMNGNTDSAKNAAKQLLDSMYLDQKMYDDAIAAMDAQTEKNKSIIDENDATIAAAKKAYDEKKAADMADYNSLMDKYKKDLEAWLGANPFSDAIKQAKKPPVSTENFTGGKADWTKAHKGTYTAKTVLDSIRDDNVLGVHGLSIATDSDQIEDLDVKVTKVISSSGEQVFEMKFKLTAPYGDALSTKWASDPSVAKDNGGIYPSKLVLDKTTGLYKDSGKPDSYGFINSGTRYTRTDPETGAQIVFQRANYTQGYNVSSNNNTVKIHMPLNSTPEQYQKALENLGIAKARPSTEGDIKVLAENKLIALMGTHQGSIKTFDGTKNMGGTARQKALDEIKQKYGVTAEDLTFSTEPNGRVKLFLSDEKAAEMAKKYKVTHFKHEVSASSDPERWVSMLSGKNPGLLSTYHRYTEGITGNGSSSATDMSNGSGDYNYVTPMSNGASKASGHGRVVLKPSAVFKRTDFWANPSDGWGKKADGGGTSNVSPYELFDKKGNIGYNSGGVYEVLPKDTIPISDFAYVVVGSSVRKTVIDRLTEMGVLEINGVPLEKFILTEGMDSPVDLSTPGAA